MILVSSFYMNFIFVKDDISIYIYTSYFLYDIIIYPYLWLFLGLTPFDPKISGNVQCPGTRSRRSVSWRPNSWSPAVSRHGEAQREGEDVIFHGRL